MENILSYKTGRINRRGQFSFISILLGFVIVYIVILMAMKMVSEMEDALVSSEANVTSLIEVMKYSTSMFRLFTIFIVVIILFLILRLFLRGEGEGLSDYAYDEYEDDEDEEEDDEDEDEDEDDIYDEYGNIKGTEDARSAEAEDKDKDENIEEDVKKEIEDRVIHKKW